jgi:hypothetical protein
VIDVHGLRTMPHSLRTSEKVAEKRKSRPASRLAGATLHQAEDWWKNRRTQTAGLTFAEPTAHETRLEAAAADMLMRTL